MIKSFFIWNYEVAGADWVIGCADDRICLALPVDDVALSRILGRLRRRIGLEPVRRRVAVCEEAAGQLDAYLRGDRNELGFDVAVFGTDFQLRVWQAMMAVGRGDRISYGELAVRCGCQGGVRAVARACGDNAVLIAVPCHRVVASDGGPGGYSAGVELKRRLLSLEEREEYGLER